MIDEKVKGSGHPDTATSYNNTGVIYYLQGNYPQALDSFLRALEIREQVLGKGHLRTADSYNNVGRLYQRLNNYPLALKYLQQSLTIRQSILPLNHEDIQKSIDYIKEVEELIDKQK